MNYRKIGKWVLLLVLVAAVKLILINVNREPAKVEDYPVRNEKIEEVEKVRQGREKPAPEVARGWLELPAVSDRAGAKEYAFSAEGRNYTALYDEGTYSALWVAYPLTAGHTGDFKRPGNWYFAPEIDQEAQVNLTKRSYNDGYSRGHQIPNGDRNGNHLMQKQTFYVINSVPQLQDGFNGRIWNAMENAVRNAVPQGDTLYVVTGPVYQTAGGSELVKYTSAKDDDKKIPVANYFYKVLMKVRRSEAGGIDDASAIGFWLEHRDYDHSEFGQYAVSVDEIEEKTGFDFFTNLPDSLETAAEQNAVWTSFKRF